MTNWKNSFKKNLVLKMRNGTSLTPTLNNWQLDSHKSVTFFPKDSSKLTHTLLLLFYPITEKMTGLLNDIKHQSM